MLRKLKFYIIGLVPGLIIVFFVLNKKGASCSGYLPNSRVLAETLSKDFQFQPQFQEALFQNKMDEKFLRDSVFTNAKIDFERSQAQKKPCPNYLLQYPEKQPKFEITFEKCDSTAHFFSFKNLNQ